MGRRKFPGLKQYTDAAGSALQSGRGAFPLGRSHTGRRGGLVGSAYVGMSNEEGGVNPPRRKPKGSWARFSTQGESAPKPRPQGVGDGQRVNTPVLLQGRLSDGGTQKGNPAGDWMCRCKLVGGSRRQIPVVIHSEKRWRDRQVTKWVFPCCQEKPLASL